MNGHELEEKIKNEFREVNRFYEKNNNLSKEIINKIIDDFPEFIQNDLFELFNEIQK